MIVSAAEAGDIDTLINLPVLPFETCELVGTFLDIGEKAFNEGSMSCERLLGAMVAPFIKISQYINRKSRCPGWKGEAILAQLNCAWAEEMCYLANSGLRTSEKHAELMEEMFAAHVPEVRLDLLILCRTKFGVSLIVWVAYATISQGLDSTLQYNSARL